MSTPTQCASARQTRRRWGNDSIHSRSTCRGSMISTSNVRGGGTSDATASANASSDAATPGVGQNSIDRDSSDIILQISLRSGSSSGNATIFVSPAMRYCMRSWGNQKTSSVLRSPRSWEFFSVRASVEMKMRPSSSIRRQTTHRACGAPERSTVESTMILDEAPNSRSSAERSSSSHSIMPRIMRRRRTSSKRQHYVQQPLPL